MIGKEIGISKEYQVGGINLRDEVAIHPNKKISFGMLEALGMLTWFGVDKQLLWL